MIHLLDIVKNAHRVAIAGHVRPDGDCAGSCLALYRYLKQNSSAEVSLYLERLQDPFDKLPGAEAVCSELSVESQPYDVFFALDCGDAGRLGFAQSAFEQASEKVCIDHHITNVGYGDINHIEAHASSTSEILYELMEKDKIDYEIARCLYTGILHDTGVFHHDCTSGRTMEIAGWLMEQGLDFPAIIDGEFYQKTYVQNRVMGHCLLQSQLLQEGTVIVSSLSIEERQSYGATTADLSGIIDQLRLTAGVEVAVFLYELEEQDAWKVSMRANRNINVSEVAAKFDGGGHVKAAGCTIKGVVSDIIDQLVAELKPQLIAQGYVKDENK